MIQDFVKAWDANKSKLSKFIASHNQDEYGCYSSIVQMLFSVVINPYMASIGQDVFDLERIHEIDDGDYQGTLLYLIPKETYQPSSHEYVATFVYYGSCSVCDTLYGIQSDGNDSNKVPSKEQVKGYMDLCLHILQHCKFPFNYEED